MAGFFGSKIEPKQFPHPPSSTSTLCKLGMFVLILFLMNSSLLPISFVPSQGVKTGYFLCHSTTQIQIILCGPEDLYVRVIQSYSEIKDISVLVQETLRQALNKDNKLKLLIVYSLLGLKRSKKTLTVFKKKISNSSRLGNGIESINKNELKKAMPTHSI